MSTSQTHSEQDKKRLRALYYDYGPTALFALGLTAVVCLSYYFSRFIPEDLFAHYISPCLHICMVLAAIIGAIVLRKHVNGVPARRIWQQALIAWAVIDVGMLVEEKYLGLSTIVRGVQTIDCLDFIVRDVLAVILLAYPFEVLCPKWLTWWRGALLVLPSILVTFLDMLLNEDLRALQIVYPLLIAVWLWSQIRTYRARMEENYSSLENTAMTWVRVYLIILTIIGLSYFYLSFTYHPTRLFTQQWLVLALLIYNTVQIVARPKPWVDAEPEPAEQATEDDLKRQYRERLEAWMAKDKPYLNPEFRLVDLMQVLPMNRTYLSQFINVEYGCTFYQYVTNYRIEEAQRLMREHPDMKLQDIAEHSGFSSATVFSRTFAKETGKTPTEWLGSVDNT